MHAQCYTSHYVQNYVHCKIQFGLDFPDFFPELLFFYVISLSACCNYYGRIQCHCALLYLISVISIWPCCIVPFCMSFKVSNCFLAWERSDCKSIMLYIFVQLLLPTSTDLELVELLLEAAVGRTLLCQELLALPQLQSGGV